MRPLSVIIPVAIGDESWKELVPTLSYLEKDDEIILSSAQNLNAEIKSLIHRTNFRPTLVFCLSPSGRAKQMNAGAKMAKNDFLLFLHADSKLPHDSFSKLKNHLITDYNGLYFFNLKFLSDGPALTKINSLGAWFRSNILKLPFGDQGFCLNKNVFYDLGTFDETTPLGEDHLLVWMAHRKKIKVKSIQAPIYTSARRYREEGWLKTTIRFFYLTQSQAISQLRLLLKERRRHL